MRLRVNSKLLVVVIVCGLLLGMAAVFASRVVVYLAFFVGFLVFVQVIQKDDAALDALVTGLILAGVALLVASVSAFIAGTTTDWASQSIRVTLNVIWAGGLFIIGSWLFIGIIWRLVQWTIGARDS